MTTNSVNLKAVLLVILSAAAAAPAQAPTPAPPAPAAPTISAQDEAEANAQLGERFYDLGLSFAGSSRPSKSTLQESAALIEAAVKKNPKEPRFLRFLAVLKERAGDIDGAIDAWIKYRDIDVVRNDEVAQISLIDLYLGQMQASDVKLSYLKSIIARETISPRVKALAAARAVPLLDQRSRSEALAMLADARKFYPLPEVTLLEWQMLPSDATPVQQLNALLNILRANPMQAEAIANVADRLAAAGLSEDSVRWYTVMLDVHRAQGTVPLGTSVVNYLVEKYRAGETTFVAEQLDQYLPKNPQDIFSWFLRLTIARSDESAQLLKQAQQALATRADGVSNAVLSISLPAKKAQASAAPSAATQASPQPSPLMAKAIAHVLQLEDSQPRAALVEALADLAWFELYFDHNAAAAAPYLTGLKELLPADNLALNRLIGWYDFVSGDEAASRKLFTAQQDTDPLSLLGLFRLEEKNNHAVEMATVGSKIASQAHSGVLGAILWEAIKGRGFKPAKPIDNADLKAALDKFPMDWLQVIHNPGRFYAVRGEPISVGHRLGEPLVARITIENNCKIDLTIGDYGLIKPTILFDVQIHGAGARTFPGIVQDRIMGRQVLAAGESVTQEVRVDRGELSDTLRSRPGTSLILSADVLTNPIQAGPAWFQASAGGYARNFSKMFMRTPAKLDTNADRLAFFARMESGTPGEKMLDIELLAAYINQFVQPNATPQQHDLAHQFTSVIDKYREDAAPGVKLWASYIFACQLAGGDQQRAIGDMLQAKSWDRRMLGLVAARRYLPTEITRQTAIRQANTDPDPLVKAYAAAMVESLNSPATRPVTIQPGN